MNGVVRVSDRSNDPGDLLVRVGGIVFGVGMLSVVAVFVPYVFDLPRLPWGAYWLAMLMPLGLLVALGGLFATARENTRRRRARQAAAATATAAG
ncbi:hypothetical protein KSE_44300 [Kitasatospora setae KM-6054]|uniref:Integral membrane protein n=1 Tax=Kitasatospora setae (strain ATCC 33774 / DSM 43861 / JCM 3304 / KCC A-0304 / NBRC 14216 / KM-6054) TaxID=452652 RepID=E4NFD3_KITSK|nr:hypothetical protein KSE_44300 [Kitasatospora setae KM-6054]